MTIPTVLTPVKDRDIIKRMHSFNVDMTQRAKEMSNGIGTEGLETVLENLSQLMVADFKDLESLDIPIHVMKQTNLFAVVTISRILQDMYKLEKKLGRKIEGTNQKKEAILEKETKE